MTQLFGVPKPDPAEVMRSLRHAVRMRHVSGLLVDPTEAGRPAEDKSARPDFLSQGDLVVLLQTLLRVQRDQLRSIAEHGKRLNRQTFLNRQNKSKGLHDLYDVGAGGN